MARPPLPPGEEKKLFNARLDPDLQHRLKVICARRSVLSGSKFSEGAFLEKQIKEFRLPKMPTPEQIEAYCAANPKHAPVIRKILNAPPPVQYPESPAAET